MTLSKNMKYIEESNIIFIGINKKGVPQTTFSISKVEEIPCIKIFDTHQKFLGDCILNKVPRIEHKQLCSISN